MHTLNSKPVWTTFDEVLKFSNNITAAIYAFAYADKKPDDTTWPFSQKELFYIGISGGQDNDFTFDKKVKDTAKGRFQTRFHKRMKDHKNNLIGNGKSTESMYRLVREEYCNFEDPDKQIFVCVIVPQNIDNAVMRAAIKTVEQEQILLHYQTYAKIPFGNIAERLGVSDLSRHEDSVSQQRVKNLKDNNLTNFMS